MGGHTTQKRWLATRPMRTQYRHSFKIGATRRLPGPIFLTFLTFQNPLTISLSNVGIRFTGDGGIGRRKDYRKDLDRYGLRDEPQCRVLAGSSKLNMPGLGVKQPQGASGVVDWPKHASVGTPDNARRFPDSAHGNAKHRRRRLNPNMC